jgi:hypothetical protein
VDSVVNGAAARSQFREHALAYVGLAALFVLSVGVLGQRAYDRFDILRHGGEYARPPFYLGDANWGAIALRPEAEAAGLKYADAVLAVNGHPVDGFVVYYGALARAKAGDRLEVQVRAPDPHEAPVRNVSIALRAYGDGSSAPGFSSYATALMQSLALPAVCIALGFWVVAVRIGDRSAWLLLMLLLSTLWPAAIPARNELKKRLIEFRDSRWLIAQACVDGDHRAECLSEQLEVFACTRRGFDVFLRSQGQRLNLVAKEDPHVILRAPEERRPRAGRRGRRVPRQDPKEVATCPARSEVHHANHAAGPAHAQHLVRRRLMVGREHRAKTRGHDIELGIGERKLLCVAFHPFEVDVRVACRAAALVEVLGCHIRRDDLRTRLRRANGDIASASRDVEHALSLSNAARLDQHRPELPYARGREPVIVAQCPHRPNRCIHAGHLRPPLSVDS